MKDEILNDLLSDILQQQSAILKVLMDLKQERREVSSEATKVMGQVPVVDDGFKLFAHNFFCEFNKGLQQLKSLSEKIPIEVNSISHRETKVVLFSKQYDEGNYGAKDLLRGFYIFIGICFAMFLLIKYIPIYLGIQDEKMAYKSTVHLYYFKTDKKSGEALLKTVNHFKNGDTSYINELNRFYKKLEKIKK